MIIDSHCHAGKGDGLTGPWDTSAPLDRYLRRARAAGIAHTVLLPAFSSDYAAANRGLASIVARDQGRFSGYAMVHPVRDQGRIAAIVREAVDGFGFRGIKIHRHDARITREICQVADELSVPILYDVMGETWTVDLIAREYPRVEFVIPHLGSFGDDWRAHLSLIDIMSRHRNVSTDTSGVRRFDYLVEAVRRVGPERILYGSDGPELHPGVELAKVRALGLDPTSELAVLGGNWLRVTRASGLSRGPGRAIASRSA
jgi:predicted TIM-barrel fold metal-dependent hydrolase